MPNLPARIPCTSLKARRWPLSSLTQERSALVPVWSRSDRPCCPSRHTYPTCWHRKCSSGLNKQHPTHRLGSLSHLNVPWVTRGQSCPSGLSDSHGQYPLNCKHTGRRCQVQGLGTASPSASPNARAVLTLLLQTFSVIHKYDRHLILDLLHTISTRQIS